MKKRYLGALSLLGILAFLSGCAGMTARRPPPVFTPAAMATGQYMPKVANFEFVLDTSYSMGECGNKNLQTAKSLISAINQSLPTDVHFIGGLRTFGDHPPKSYQPTALAYGMTSYTQGGLQKGLNEVQAGGGNSPLPKAIEDAGDDLKGLRGRSALVIVSDGQKELEMGGAPAAAARLKKAMGADLCIYTIAVGGDPAGEKFLQEVARAGGCGFSTTAAALAAPGALASFVEEVFLAPKPAAARDSDGDGVIDSRDKCPDTPKGELVDENGCSLKLTLHINFDFDKATIRPEFAPELKKAAEFIRKHPKVPYILIEGYTDSTGDAAYNLHLSQRRAEAVKRYLIDNYGIAPKRLIARGGGESNPVADNSTKEGRAQNRRTEITCCAVIPPE